MSVHATGVTTPPKVRLVIPPPVGAPRLDAAQADVVAHTGSPLLVLAGPGTGKTATITEAVVARITDGMSPEDILVLTFSRVAAAELRARIGARLNGAATPTVATFHSFAWQLLTTHGEPDTVPKVLLSGPEQDAIVRDLLGIQDSAWFREWPAATRMALTSSAIADHGEVDAVVAVEAASEATQGESEVGSAALAAEVVRLMAAARAHGWEPEDLARHADRAGVPEWRAVASLFAEYLQILDYREAVDYAELVHRATLLVRRSQVLPGRYRAIYVDEYQDTDPAQVHLLQALVVPGTTLVAVGDPDQAIYRFRGADVRGITRFAEDFAHAVHHGPGDPRSTSTPQGSVRHVVLNTTRRFGPQIRAIADAWIAPVSLAGMPVQVAREHRAPACAGGAGQVEVVTFDTPGNQAAGVADILRRARFADGSSLAWSDMAVLVRSGVADIPRLRQELLAAGIPVEVPASDQPLAADPALAVFLTGIRLAIAPQSVNYADTESFLTSPLIGMTALEVRRLLRGLRRADRVEAEQEGRPVATSQSLLARLFAPDSARVTGVPTDLDPIVTQVLELLDRVQLASDHPDEALWELWTFRGDDEKGGLWARALYRQALAGGPQAFAADAALDAIVELFRIATRVPAGMNSMRFVEHLAGQQLPAARPDDGAFSRDSVRLLTAHRSKGGQWPLVVLVGMQQDAWPSAQIGGSLLAPDRVGVAGPTEPLTRNELIADERRLAFVAATRAQQRLVVTAVAETTDGGAQPSELFAEAKRVVVGGEHDGSSESGSGPGHLTAVRAGVRGHLTPASVVASLRTALTTALPAADHTHDDPRPPDWENQEFPRVTRGTAAVAAGWLRWLAAAGITPLADPARWWAISPPTSSTAPLVSTGKPVVLSASAVEAIATCPLRWFLDRRLHAGPAGATSAGYGSVVHAVIAGIIGGDITEEQDAVERALNSIWGELGYAATWESDVAKRRALADIQRFVVWRRSSARTIVAAESGFDFPLQVQGQSVRLRGSIDILDVSDAADQPDVRVVDIKTGAQPPTKNATLTNVQLGTYQLAVQNGAVAGFDVNSVLVGGLLLYISKPVRDKPSERTQPALHDADWLLTQVADAATTITAEQVIATVNDSCRTCAFQDLCPAQTHVSWVDNEGGQS